MSTFLGRRRTISWLGVAFGIAVAACSSSQRVGSTEAGFAVVMPGSVVSASEPAPGGGDQRLTRWQSTAAGRDYMVVAQDLAAAPKDPRGSLNAIVNRTVDSLRAEQQGTLVYSRSIQLGDYPGEQFQVRVRGRAVTLRIYLAADRKQTFHLNVETAQEDDATNEIDRFFDSFQLFARSGR